MLNRERFINQYLVTFRDPTVSGKMSYSDSSSVCIISVCFDLTQLLSVVIFLSNCGQETQKKNLTANMWMLCVSV